MNVSNEQAAGLVVVDGVGWLKMKNWMYWRIKGVETVYVPPVNYSLGQRRKKNF